VVDLTIAANFARELTEQQFTAQPRRARRPEAAAPARAATQPARARRSGSRLGQALHRLAQVRG
jgi:hypothetical protein